MPQHCATFNLDEYVGMPRDHMHSQHTFMWTHFFSQLDVKRENCYSLDGNAEDLTAECERFEAAIASLGGLDYTFFSTGTHYMYQQWGSVLTHLPFFVVSSTTLVAPNGSPPLCVSLSRGV